MLAIDAAHSAGFRDSLDFFRRNPLMHKLSLSRDEKARFMSEGRIHGNMRNKTVAIVTVRNTYKTMGAKFVKGGRYVEDVSVFLLAWWWICVDENFLIGLLWTSSYRCWTDTRSSCNRQAVREPAWWYRRSQRRSFHTQKLISRRWISPSTWFSQHTRKRYTNTVWGRLLGSLCKMGSLCKTKKTWTWPHYRKLVLWIRFSSIETE